MTDQLTPGAIVETWCSECKNANGEHGTKTPHRYQPGTIKPLTCIPCEEKAISDQKKVG
jgi:hypothetical protein